MYSGASARDLPRDKMTGLPACYSRNPAQQKMVAEIAGDPDFSGELKKSKTKDIAYSHKNSLTAWAGKKDSFSWIPYQQKSGQCYCSQCIRKE